MIFHCRGIELQRVKEQSGCVAHTSLISPIVRSVRTWRCGVISLLALVFAVTSCGGSATPTITVPPTSVPAATAVPALAAVKTLADVVLRAGPGADFDETVSAPKATELFLLGHARGYDCQEWVLVRTPSGEEGWVRPILVNVDVSKSTFPAAPLPTPVSLSAPIAACTNELALVQINNNYARDLDVFVAGAEPGFTLAVGGNTSTLVCLAPGDYCYDITDGETHETGALFFPEGECTCWHWGGPPPTAGSCTCKDDPSQYRRP